MIKAVLFDLDNTLIDINLAAFMARYMAGQARILSRVLRVAPPFASSAIIAAYLAMCSTRRTDALFNEGLFHRVVERRLRRPFGLEPLAEVMQYYDSCYIERFKGGLVQAGPRPGSHEVIEAARELGLTVALATNPVVSLAVDKVRMTWGELDPSGFADVSHVGNARRTKPNALYFEEFAAQLGCAASECLMVGNDAGSDFPRPSIGMPVAYVGHGRPKKGVFRGSLIELASRLPELIATLDAQRNVSAASAMLPYAMTR